MDKQAWCIKGPDGELLLHTLREDEISAYKAASPDYFVTELNDTGYRAVQVALGEQNAAQEQKAVGAIDSDRPQPALAAAPSKFVRVPEDTERLAALAEMWRYCPHAVVTFNDGDDEQEDENGPIPIGYSIRVRGCSEVNVSAPTLAEAIDLLKTPPDEDGNILSASAKEGA